MKPRAPLYVLAPDMELTPKHRRTTLFDASGGGAVAPRKSDRMNYDEHRLTQNNIVPYRQRLLCASPYVGATARARVELADNYAPHQPTIDNANPPETMNWNALIIFGEFACGVQPPSGEATIGSEHRSAPTHGGGGETFGMETEPESR